MCVCVLFLRLRPAICLFLFCFFFYLYSRSPFLFLFNFFCVFQYCLEAGVSVMTGKTVQHIPDWLKVLNSDSILLMLPGILLGVLLMYCVRRFRHFLVLPGFLVCIPVLFYILLLCSRNSLDDARLALGNGFVANATDNTQFWQAWEHYDFSLVHWHAIPAVIPTWIVMFFVVAFSSSLDVAAIQMEVGRPLDFNHELRMVGLSNFFSGVTGGYTGSCKLCLLMFVCVYVCLWCVVCCCVYVCVCVYYGKRKKKWCVCEFTVFNLNSFFSSLSLF